MFIIVMPYRRRKQLRGGRRRSRYNYRYKGYGVNCKFDATRMASNALRGVNFLKGLVNAEMHYSTPSIPAQTPGTAGSVIHISGISQGDGIDNRQGLSILGKSIQVVGDILINPAVNNVSVRVWIIQDLMNNGTLPAFTDIFTGANTVSLLNIANADRFWVLASRRFDLCQSGVATKMFKIYRKLNFHIKYNGTGSNIADASKNALFLVIVSDTTTDFPTVRLSSRLAYYDN